MIHHPLFKAIRHDPVLWLLIFVPVLFVVAKLLPDSHTPLFVLSVAAIIPLAAMLSHSTESVAAKTGDSGCGLLNATLGNLTELVIALAALKSGQYMLVNATLAVVTVFVALVSEVFVASVRQAAISFGMTPAFVGSVEAVIGILMFGWSTGVLFSVFNHLQGRFNDRKQSPSPP